MEPKNLLLCAACTLVFQLQGLGEDFYELHGTIEKDSDRGFRDGFPVVFIQGSTTPFMASTIAGPSGEFKFKKLLPGPYTLVIAIPWRGEMRQTIEVGPTFADTKRRVKETFRFEEDESRPFRHTVSAIQLTIPDRARREYRKARDRLGKHDVDEAVKHLKRAVELAPQFAAAWNHLGIVAYHSDSYQQAEEYFREALRQENDFYPALVNLGGALLSQGKAKASLSINLQAVQARPDDPLACSQLGQSYFQLGQYEEAEEHLKRSKTLDPKHFSFPQLVLAEIYQLREQYSDLVGELEEFLEYHPDSETVSRVEVWLKRARSHLNDSSQ